MIIPEMIPSEAKAYVEEHYRKVAQRWRERVTGSPFMTQLVEGRLPRAALRTFFKNWASYTIEINTLEDRILSQAHRLLPQEPRPHGTHGPEAGR